MKTFENNLLIELRRGDHNAFEKIFEFYSKPLFQFSFSYLKSREASEDVVQEVMMKIWNNRQAIKSDTSFQSYVYTIALNSVRGQFNKLAKLNDLKHNILTDFSTRKAEFDDQSDYQGLLDKLQELIDRMPEKRKQVFMKKKIEEKSLRDIATELDIDPKTVEYHITEAMKFLKLEFEILRAKGLIFFYLFIGKENN
jgi:RNA polymerase sigma-70 factor (family 1)